MQVQAVPALVKPFHLPAADEGHAEAEVCHTLLKLHDLYSRLVFLLAASAAALGLTRCFLSGGTVIRLRCCMAAC